MYRPAAAHFIAAAGKAHAESLDQLRLEVWLVTNVEEGAGGKLATQKHAALGNCEMAKDAVKYLVREAMRLKKQLPKSIDFKSPTWEKDVQAVWALDTLSVEQLEKAKKKFALKFHADKLTPLLARSTLDEAAKQAVISIFSHDILPAFERIKLHLVGEPTVHVVPEIREATATITDLDGGIVGVRISCLACSSDTTEDSVVIVDVPGPMCEDDAECLVLNLVGGELSITLDSDNFPWLFASDVTHGSPVVTFNMMRQMVSGECSEVYAVQLVVGVNADVNLCPCDEEQEELLGEHELDETLPGCYAQEALSWWAEAQRRYSELKMVGGSPTPAKPTAEETQQKRRRRGGVRRRGGTHRRGGRGTKWAAKCEWLEQRMQELTARLERVQLQDGSPRDRRERRGDRAPTPPWRRSEKDNEVRMGGGGRTSHRSWACR